MSGREGPYIGSNGLVFSYDVNNNQKSFIGQTTTNVASTGAVWNVYNNVPSDVTVTLVATSDAYQGTTVYKLTMTPTTSTGVSYLTNGNNPGIGVYITGTGSGGGTAGVYTGYSIFFKPTVEMYSNPIITSYSNIPGWQSSYDYEVMPNDDGWCWANVIWYDATTTRSDGKFWAINPKNATLNVPIVIYWAGAFKEEQNRSTFVSKYTPNARSSTQVVRDLTSLNTVTANSLLYNATNSGTTPTFSYDGTSYLEIPDSSVIKPDTGYITMSAWFKSNSLSRYDIIINKENAYELAAGAGYIDYALHNAGSWTWYGGISYTPNQYYHVAVTYDGTTESLYLNGVSVFNRSQSGSIAQNTNELRIGARSGPASYFTGNIDVVQIYNRALSADEVYQNFSALRGRFGV